MKKKWVALTALAVMIVYVLSILLPYLYQPEVQQDFVEEFQTMEVRSDGPCADRAIILEDNEAALAERIRMIGQAEDRILFSTFHFKSDNSGKQVLAALYHAAQRGVEIQILVDGAFSIPSMTGNPYFQLLAHHENVTIKRYNPINLLTPWKWMSRLHDKYIIVDHSLYLLGGRNTYDCFLSNLESERNCDRDVLVVNTGSQDSSLYELEQYFTALWDQSDCKIWPGRQSKRTNAAKAELLDLFQSMKAEHSSWFEPVDYTECTYPTNRITLLSNPTQPHSKRPELFYCLAELMKQAEERVVIHTPYIICNDDMYSAFRSICEGEAEVTLMTNAAATGANPFGTTDYVKSKEKILDTGLQVMEYAGSCSYHAKSILIDDDLSIIGSFNMDMRSAYQDTELMLVIQSEEINQQLASIMETYQKDSAPAVISQRPMAELLSGRSLPEQAAKCVLWLVTPFIRFIL